MYSPLTNDALAKTLLEAGVKSLRKPGWSVPATPEVQLSSGARTVLEQPSLESTRFSLNGVSRVRAYETRSTLFVGLTL